ncbi:MAG: hypothetical protein IKU35_06440 [Bacteroidaceae bacterium]|nr:hypothetical protein [Bacteroidaceae bacterium]
MYPINSDILAIFQSGAMQYARVTIGTEGQTGYQLIENDRIKQGGMSLNRFAETGDTVKVGSCASAELTLVLDNRDGIYDDYDFVGKEAYVEVGVEDDNDIVYIPIGYFTFDEAAYDKSALRLAALDRMLFFERTIDASQLSFPYTVTQLLTRICTVCGVSLGNIGTLLNGGISVPSLPKDAKTYRDLLVWIAEISGNVAYIAYDGTLMLKWYQGSQFSLTTANRKDSTLERGSVLITGVEVVVNDTTTLYGTADRTVRIENNPLIPSGQETFVATGVFNKVGGFSYTPFTATVLPMPHIEPLDGCTFVTADNESVFVPITDWSFTLNGSCRLAGKSNQATYRRGYGLADAILQGVNIADKAVTTAKIADNAVDTAQLAALAVKEGKIATNAVTEDKIAANAVVADKIASNAVTTDKLNALAVTAAKIASGAVTADKISVTDLEAIGATIANWNIGANMLYKTITSGGYEYRISMQAPASPTTDSTAFCVERRTAGSTGAYTKIYNVTYGGKVESRDFVANGRVVIQPDYDLQEAGVYAIDLVDNEYGLYSNFNPDFANIGCGAGGGTHIDGAEVKVYNDGSSSGTSDDTYVELSNYGEGYTGLYVSENGTGRSSELTAQTLKVNNRDLLKEFKPFTAWSATLIPANADLNTVTYLNAGRYYCGTSANVQTLSNCPVSIAFSMEVDYPISTRSTPASTWQYCIRTITTAYGETWTQYVSGGATANVYTYNAWTKIRGANTDGNVVYQINTPSTNADYRILLGETADNTDRYERVRKSSGLLYNPSSGTMYIRRAHGSTTSASSGIVMGNSVASGTAGATYGALFLYGQGAYWARFQDTDGVLTANRTYTLPNKSGELAILETDSFGVGNRSIAISNANAQRSFSLNTAAGATVYLQIATGGTQGLWSNGYCSDITDSSTYTTSNKWIIRRNASGNVYVDEWAGIGSSGRPVYFSSSGRPVAVTETSGSGTRNTTYTSSGTCSYVKQGKIVSVTVYQLMPKSTVVDGNNMFTGLPAASAEHHVGLPCVNEGSQTNQTGIECYVDTSGNFKFKRGGAVIANKYYAASFTYISAS